jgi:HK97 family phage major capsid protein
VLIIFCEQCPILGTVGDIILADLANGYILADKGGMQTDVSIHVRFVYDESVFRFVYRCDGQPALASAITPYKGDAVSHFVALESRTA